MSSRMSAGSNLSSSQDPRRENRIYRYIPITNKPNQDPLPDYVSLLGMIFSMLGLMMRVSRNYKFPKICIFSTDRSGIEKLYYCVTVIE